jgi:hypothetical protein
MDARLDSRTYEELEASINKFEQLEDMVISIFCSKYKDEYGGDISYENYGFRAKGLERDIGKTNALPDFKIKCTAGPLKGEPTVEVQCMQYDRPHFHIKKPKLNKAIETKSIFIQLSALDSPNERFAVITPGIMLDLEYKSRAIFGIVGYPGTVCGNYPNGKPAYRILDGWLEWNYTNIKGRMEIN